MSTPPIQYATTNDGFDIAYTVSGSGRSVLVPPLIHNHVQFNWLNDVLITRRTRFLRRLSESFRVVAFDNRGQGMSSRGLPANLRLDDFDKDTAAIAQCVGEEPFVIVACARAGHLAVRYAVAHPEKISALILISCPISQQSWHSGLFDLLPKQNWEFFLQTQLLDGLSKDEVQRGLSMLKDTSTPSDYAIAWRLWQYSDISEWLPRLTLPTLVLHPRDFPLLPPEESIKLAARIPAARMLVIEGSDIFGDADEGVLAIEDFLKDVDAGSRTPAGSKESPIEPPALSARQIEVLRLITVGKTNREIAEELVLSLRTVERHVEDLYAKLAVRNRSEATAYALKNLTLL
jgi:pimeloyl-ACP methyl ester carboxylesterase/DNA-binding CsgD family transcriptional regulator